MDLNTVVEIRDARHASPWRPGDAWLAGGTHLFSEPQPHLRRLHDLSRTGWEPLRHLPDGSLEIAATCTIARLSRFGRSLDPAAHPAAPLIEQCCRAFLASFKVWNVATVGGNLCNALPAGPMISLTTALDGVCLLLDQAGGQRGSRVADFVTGAGLNDLAEGELLRAVTLPPRALSARTAFRQASLYALGRSGVLLVGTEEPPDPAERAERAARTDHTGRTHRTWALTVTASTVRPFRLAFAGPPSADRLRAALDAAIGDGDWFDDIHGLPAWRRHMTYRLAEEIRAELAARPGGDATEAGAR
ncbi:FAD binding domain-containing protein [Streptomyces sp. NPDC088194]|uniref:FAD binding domain-containing protein n=1 Tax=Streptomyces sp. NPDC088194 TaxID=3154931 RepID=UPI00344B2AEF